MPVTAAAPRPLSHAPRRRKATGFTLLELMVVIAIIAILALIALPSLLERNVRQQVSDSLAIADIAKGPIAAAWAHGDPLPADNAAAGLPAADTIVGNYVAGLLVDHGAIHLTFGNNANPRLSGKTLTLRPAVVEGEHVVPVAWVCGNAPVPGKMTAQGDNRTNLPPAFLPLGCR
jgi:type IV pilus assembly protein PilA